MQLSGREMGVLAVAGVLLVAALAGLGVVSGEGDTRDDTVLAGADGSTTTTTVLTESTLPGSPDTTAATVAPGAGTTPTTAKSGGGAAASTGGATPGKVQVAKAGKYRYKSVSRGAEGEQQQEAEYLIESTGSAGGNTEQRHTIKLEEGDQANDVSWRADGQYLVATKFGGKDFAASCQWKPSVLLTRAELTKGTEWSTDSICDLDFGMAKGTARRQATTKVVDSGTYEINGQKIPVWIIHTDSTITVDIQANEGQKAQSVIKEASDEDFAPSLGLAAHSVGKGTSTTNGKSEDTYRELTLLTPSPS